MKKLFVTLLSTTILGSLFIGCSTKASTQDNRDCTNIVQPDWSRNAVIYEVNIRQFTEEGTFKAFQSHLPRLKELGVDILWLMPVHPVSEVNRKGELGSYYAVQDYKAVNPEFGTLEDFKSLVDEAHQLGMKVILDWVANHTGCDNVWLQSHPEWYKRDSIGNFIAPYDWTDVYELDYTKNEVREAMADALEFWVKDYNIDGYRCDVAFLVPLDFWEMARKRLDAIKPVFMLAEAEKPELTVNAFNMVYNWPLKDVMNQIAKGKNAEKANYIHKSLLSNASPIKNAQDIDTLVALQDSVFPCDAYQMNFITNHDENSWDGTEHERMGKGANTFAVLTYTLNGMPLIYTGQEVGFDRRFEFFKKDTPPNWQDNETVLFYKKLNQLKKSQPALNAGKSGGKFIKYRTSDDASIYAFSRKLDEKNEVLVILNLTPEDKLCKFTNAPIGNYTNYFTGKKESFDSKNVELSLKAWEYKVLTK